VDAVRTDDVLQMRSWPGCTTWGWITEEVERVVSTKEVEGAVQPTTGLVRLCNTILRYRRGFKRRAAWQHDLEECVQHGNTILRNLDIRYL